MSDHFEPYRQIVSARDADFSVRIADFDDLIRLQQEAQDNGLTAKWSSLEALVWQVEPTTVVWTPLLRNGRQQGRPDSYRCYIWFTQRPNSSRTVSLFDVTATSLSSLRQAASPEQLRYLVRMILDGYRLDAIW
jgi:hypothetical protein